MTGLEPATLRRLHEAPPSNRDWRRLCPVYTGTALPAAEAAQPPVLGEYRLEAERIRFHPRFPLVAGMSYVVRCDLSAADGPMLEATLELAAPDSAPATRLLEIYPTASLLPENQLKFTLQFSGPMSRGEAYEHIRLLDGAGDHVLRPFLVVEQELWDGEGERFTLFLDPGRIKRGLRPHLEAGPPLTSGERYVLAVAPEWLDGSGSPLVSGFEKPFVAGPADRQAPDPAAWDLRVPLSGTLEPLLVHFPEPLDWALLQRNLGVVGPGGREMGGRVDIGPEERSWSFTPELAWSPGRYALEVDPVLEDLAGNNLRGLFDIEVGVDPEEREVGVVKVPFAID